MIIQKKKIYINLKMIMVSLEKKNYVYNKGGCNYDILYNSLISSNKISEICISNNI